MFTIKKRGLLQCVKKVATPNMVEQPSSSDLQKVKAVVEQRTLATEKTLRMVPMIAGHAISSAEEEQKSKQKKRPYE